jgi:serine/threonine-protein kinase
MLVWVGRDGAEEQLADTSRPFLGFPRISPDGNMVSLTLGLPRELWVYDLKRGAFTRISGIGSAAAWSPDGERLAYASEGTLILQSMQGGETTKLPIAVNEPFSWSSDGKSLLLRSYRPQTLTDIQWLTLGSDKAPKPLVRDPDQDWAASLSPDGKWVAYTSNESGEAQVYVIPFRTPGPRRLLSTSKGESPVWGPNGKELFYWDGESMMVVHMPQGPDGTLSRPVPLFKVPYEVSRTFRRNYDIAPDGTRFLMVKTIEDSYRNAKINVVLDWVDELTARVQAR